MAATNPETLSHAPSGEDARADRITFFWIILFSAAFLVVDILSNLTEQSRFDLHFTPAELIIYEVTSVSIIVLFLPAIAWVTSRATPGQHGWRYVFGVHAAASLVFSTVHIAAMVGLRKITFLIFFEKPYIFTDNLPRDFIYEYRKDILAYSLFVFFITFGRQLAQQRREIAAAREDAKATQCLTLKSGGRSIMINASDVRWAKSAANYVEVSTNEKTHLARATLTAIENQLIEAGARAIRVHRSYLINADYIREIRPTGEGDVVIEMSDGAKVPGSRRYRDRLPTATA